MLADCVEDHVVRLAVLREVLAQAIEDVPRAERPHELDVLRVADRRHLGLEVVREQLDRGRSDGARGAVDEDALPLQRIRRSQAGQREQRAVGDGRRLLVRQPRRLRCDHPAFTHGHVLRVRAALDAEHLVADPELRHGRTDLLDTARELRAGGRPPRTANAGEETGEPVLDAAHAHGVAAGDRRGVDPDEHLVVLRNGPVDVGDAQHLRRSVPVVDDGSHAVTSSHRFRWMGAPWLHARPAR